MLLQTGRLLNGATIIIMQQNKYIQYLRFIGVADGLLS